MPDGGGRAALDQASIGGTPTSRSTWPPRWGWSPEAARDGIALDCTDALSTAVALRLGLLLLAADPTPASGQLADQHGPRE
ncbi:hypothetical protein [Kitasatospora sp. NPDC101183]|uniref:hypothetical protein n=1 Tax=Kitasatospora sp. NPDC101183 TaxID=3364100 RepID=UPI0038302E96